MIKLPKVSAKGNAGHRVLRLTLHREFFDKIAAGGKKTEWRDNTSYWRSRLVGREYAEVIFRNGYSTRAPLMRVQCLGIRKDKSGQFAIRLGTILEVKNYRQRRR
jgi:hypothetical protein